ncbi:MAG: hypothetical protein PWQ67_760 [Clostridia bacterium]|nr:hypothetical protein [Clostridia bacterium]
MEFGCPVCNGLMSMDELCDNCDQVMEDLGRIEDFYAPYSPYEEQDDIPILLESRNNCIHLYTCLECDSDKHILIPLEIM